MIFSIHGKTGVIFLASIIINFTAGLIFYDKLGWHVLGIYLFIASGFSLLFVLVMGAIEDVD